MIAEVPNYRNSPMFTPAEKAAMWLADGMAGDHKKAPMDKIFAELRKYYTEKQIVTLGWKAGIWLGYGRLVHTLDVPAIGASCVLPLKTAAS